MDNKSPEPDPGPGLERQGSVSRRARFIEQSQGAGCSGSQGSGGFRIDHDNEFIFLFHTLRLYHLSNRLSQFDLTALQALAGKGIRFWDTCEHTRTYTPNLGVNHGNSMRTDLKKSYGGHPQILKFNKFWRLKVSPNLYPLFL